MENIGIITEYNPFHNGHLYQLEQIKENLKPKCITTVMSQDTVQRGEFASFSKFFRTQTALENGVDFVLGLPFYASNTSAEFFAKGSLKILNNFGIDTLVFGSESDDLNSLIKTAQFLVDNEKKFIKLAKNNSNISYPKVLEGFLKENNQNYELVKAPNNILSLEYLKEIYRNNYEITPLSIQRIGSGYNDLTLHQYASASAIRKALNENNLKELTNTIPYSTKLLKENYKPINEDRMYASLVTEITNHNINELTEIVGINESLANKLKKAVLNSKDLNSLITYLKSRDNLRTGINRVLLNVLAHYKKEDFKLFFSESFNPYFRLLGFSEKCKRFLRGRSGVIGNVSRDIKKLDSFQRKAFEYDLKVANLTSLNLALEEYNKDYLMKPIIVKND